VSRVRANIAALAVLRRVQQEHRPAASSEQRILARWSGWGAVPAVFDASRADYAWAREALATLLTEPELAAGARSTLNAHYTDAAIADQIWTAATSLGFTGGRVLEPGCGSGNFIGLAPPAAQLTGVEAEPLTAAIAAALYPAATIIPASFADTRIPEDHFDLTIGNVPFGQVALHDPRHNPAGHSIHNHFIVKSLRLTRPGGLVLLLTSRYTMDSRDPAARRDIASLADLVGAVRLPGGAHQRAAGTNVITDLLILRRREPGRPPAQPAWEQSHLTDFGGTTIPVNEYFLSHPENVLGEPQAGRTAYRQADLTITPPSDTIAALTSRLHAITTAARASSLTWTPPAQQATPIPGIARAAPAAGTPGPDRPDGWLEATPHGIFTEVADGVPRPFNVPRTQTAELRALLAVRDTALALLDAESATSDDTAETARLRATLNNRYDTYAARYGPVNRFTLRRTGRTDPATGQEIFARTAPPQGGFRGDPYAPLVYALEEFDPATQQATKAAIFTRRVIAPRTPRLRAGTAADALAICLDARGEPSLPEIARLLGTTESRARQDLGTLVFDDPTTGSLVTAAEYLSGNVRVKLATARQAAATAPARFTPNVSALTAVIPSSLSPAQIDACLGASWIDASYVQHFLRELLDDDTVQAERPGGQVWAIKGKTGTVLASSTWGTTRYPAPALAQAICEQRPIEVRDTIETPSGGQRTVVNLDATLAAQQKAADLTEWFASWAWEDPARATDLAATYNERFNNLVLRSYDNAELELPGLSVAFRPRPHQLAAIARMIAEPAVLLAHETGAGKTAEMIIGVTELRRLGLISKPAVVVPNHMLDQFAREWLQLYPRARILITRPDDLRGDRRRIFAARCATGAWDGIIMSRTTFEKLPLSPQEKVKYLEGEIAQLRDWIAEAKQGRGLTVKRLEGALLRAEERLKSRMDAEKDPGITFEETGVDYLCVDEGHGYKNLRTPSSITGAAIEGSQRATDLDMKISYLRRRNGRRVVTFATATPIANSVTEAYVMQKYLRPDLLEDAGIAVFDSWAATFGQAVTQVELAPEGGTSFRVKSRFASFRNTPEMLRMWHVFADVKTAADLDLPVPALAPRPADGRRVPETVAVEPSPELIDYVADLGQRAEAIRSRAVSPTEDNMLKVSGDGRRAALDLRLVGLPQTEPGKIEAAATRIAAIWRAHRDDQYLRPDGVPDPVRGSLQLVFCDLGTPGPGWNAYDELRDQLTARSLPRESVRFVHEARNPADLARLFAACRTGHVAVLIGSTEKMGVGTNVQNRAIALHHLDAPWRPADVAQRDGRILRQGNQNPEIQIIRWAAAQSFDGYMWQTLERKARFIQDVMNPSLGTREIADIGDTVLTFSEAKALATGNPLLIDKAEADANLARLIRAERAHARDQETLRRAITHHQKQITDRQQLAADINAAIARRADTRGDAFAMTIQDQRYRKRAEAGHHLLTLLRQEAANQLGYRQRNVPIGELGGFPVTATVGRPMGDVQVSIVLEGAPVGGITASQADLAEADPAGMITRLENRLTRLESTKQTALADITRARAEITHASNALGQPFPQIQDLAAARRRTTQIDKQLQEAATASTAESDPDNLTAAPNHENSDPAFERDPTFPVLSQPKGGPPALALHDGRHSDQQGRDVAEPGCPVPDREAG